MATSSPVSTAITSAVRWTGTGVNDVARISTGRHGERRRRPGIRSWSRCSTHTTSRNTATGTVVADAAASVADVGDVQVVVDGDRQPGADAAAEANTR